MFRTYDVRGIYGKDITGEKFCSLGKAMSGYANEIVVGMDYRRHNEELAAAFRAGFEGEVRYLGRAPTPAIAFHSEKLGAALTASHNPAEYNGLKPFRERRCFWPEELKELEGKTEPCGLKPPKPLEADSELHDGYVSALPEAGDALFDLCGGAACALKDVFPHRIFDEPDPAYQRHSAEPKDETLSVLKEKSHEKLGFAFDGDGDRVAVCDRGKVIDGGTVIAFIAERFMKKNDTLAVTLDVSDEVVQYLTDAGFGVEVSAVGDVFVLQKALREGAAFAGERSGHYSMMKHMPYSDGIYFGLLLSQAKAGEIADYASRFKAVTEIDAVYAKVDFAKLEEKLRTKEPEWISTIDGIKVRFPDYCLLIRASNTEPKVRVNSEAKTHELALRGMREAKELINACIVKQS
ncbi:Phosphomannomutase [Candidatus Norongarragalina meridionalis]|nr:Phosphomannomutase [Candidatus Norongarragalina meridionalis]